MADARGDIGDDAQDDDERGVAGDGAEPGGVPLNVFLSSGVRDTLSGRFAYHGGPAPNPKFALGPKHLSAEETAALFAVMLKPGMKILWCTTDGTYEFVIPRRFSHREKVAVLAILWMVWLMVTIELLVVAENTGKQTPMYVVAMASPLLWSAASKRATRFLQDAT